MLVSKVYLKAEKSGHYEKLFKYLAKFQCKYNRQMAKVSTIPALAALEDPFFDDC